MNMNTSVLRAGLHLLLPALFLVIFFSSSHAQRCAPVKGLKDSCTATHYSLSWQAHPSARSYQAKYWDGNQVVSQVVTVPRVRFTRTTHAPFELVSVQATCPNGNPSDPEFNVKGGIVITIDVIYRQHRDCGTQVDFDYVFFPEVCKYTSWDDLCYALNMVNFGNEELSSQEINEEVLVWLENDPGLMWEDIAPDLIDCGYRLASAGDFVKVFPNPFSDAFSVKMQFPSSREVELILMDSQGRQLQRESFGLSGGEFVQRKFLLGDQPKGLYFLRMQGVGGSQLWKLVKF